MAGQSWSITIKDEDGTLQLVPDVFDADPTKGLQAQNGDLVSWNNQTEVEHQPWPADSNYNPIANPTDAQKLSDPIPGWDSSTPEYLIQTAAPATIYYILKDQPSVHGTIDIVA
jgi:hypothetical protein